MGRARKKNLKDTEWGCNKKTRKKRKEVEQTTHPVQEALLSELENVIWKSEYLSLLLFLLARNRKSLTLPSAVFLQALVSGWGDTTSVRVPPLVKDDRPTSPEHCCCQGKLPCAVVPLLYTRYYPRLLMKQNRFYLNGAIWATALLQYFDFAKCKKRDLSRLIISCAAHKGIKMHK